MISPRSSRGSRISGKTSAEVAPVRGQHADAHRAAELALEIDAEGPCVRQFVILVGDARVRGFLDGAFAQVGAIAEIVDLLLLRGGFCEVIIDVGQELGTPSNSRNDRSG